MISHGEKIGLVLAFVLATQVGLEIVLASPELLFESVTIGLLAAVANVSTLLVFELRNLAVNIDKMTVEVIWRAKILFALALWIVTSVRLLVGTFMLSDTCQHMKLPR